MPAIKRLTGREILDSRGRPTVQARCELTSGAMGVASVPSGVSTGIAEAVDLRDGDPLRYRGLGCRRAASNISNELHTTLSGQAFDRQGDLDRAMITLDGTPNKARLGANALLAVSVAFARAVAAERDVPLYKHFADILGQPLRTLPRLTINLFTGGKHAGMQVPIQHMMLLPMSAPTIDDGLAMTFAVYQTAAELILRKYEMRGLTADEGGLAPAFPDATAMLADTVESIRAAGLSSGHDVAIAVDVAASHLYHTGRYRLGNQELDGTAMIEQIVGWLDHYPIMSIEDGLAEEDWSHWSSLCARIGDRILVVGDDLLCTTPTRIQRAIDEHAANALLLKASQIGTLSEASTAYTLARSAGWNVTIAGRSGDTEDNWVADLAVGWGADQIKIGSITHSERLSKYNRLLEIEAETSLPIADWQGEQRERGM